MSVVCQEEKRHKHYFFQLDTNHNPCVADVNSEVVSPEAMQSENNISGLANAIQKLHSCKSKWIESVPVKEIFKSQTVWEGIVEVFDLIDHPTTKRCYAWSYIMNDTGKRKFFAVLHQGPVDSPQNAVKAAIVSEHKK